ncbi:uncharacterized protein LOC121744203 isoform X2 [Salvia splendens]|uniref:uncharacterized protein LOC121744203 isoform X2 n=1 Tax=Salvia splendens TaxID=180675 RepID=UPI001C254C1F|nr:uncharacterized protein LOC121744203 isoform X2 [Salvia splendens]
MEASRHLNGLRTKVLFIFGKKKSSLYISWFLRVGSNLDQIESSINSDRKEKGISDDGDEEPRGAVLNALNAMLKGSLDRLKIMRESISWGHSSRCRFNFESMSKSDISMIRALSLEAMIWRGLSGLLMRC